MTPNIKTLKPDPVLKAYWRNNHRFSDLFNQVVFQGETVISPENLSDAGNDESEIIIEGSALAALTRLRDVCKDYSKEVRLAIINLENQMSVHYAMPVRSMTNDALNYTNQCKALEQEHRKNKDLVGSNEYLSGIKREDRITPVLTLIIYYNEKPWDGPQYLSDMMNISEAFKPYINDYHILVFHVKDGDKYHFKNPDNQDLFTLLSEFYHQNNRLDISRFQSKHPDMEVYWETLAAIGAITGIQALTDYAIKNEGRDVHMCTALQGLIDQGLSEGRRQARQEDIRVMISLLEDFNIPANIIDQTIKEKFNLSAAELQEIRSAD